MSGMRDVAKLAGVSLSTVSSVLSSSGKFVSPEITERVLAAAKELNYTIPDRKRTVHKTIGVVLSMATSVFFANVLNAIEETAASENNLLLYYNSNFDFEKEKNCLRSLRKQSPAGIILDSVCPIACEEEYIAWLKKNFVDKDVHVVFLERQIQQRGFYCIFEDNLKCGYDAVTHLIEQGCRCIGHIQGKSGIQVAVERLNGYRLALKKRGIPYREELIQQGDFSPYSGYLAAKRLMALNPDLSAVFAANDQMAIGAIKAIKEAGKRVPEDIAVVGVDNLNISSLLTPALSTVNIPTYQMGRLAAQIVLRASEHQMCETQHKVETNLIVRRSSEITASNDWELVWW